MSAPAKQSPKNRALQVLTNYQRITPPAPLAESVGEVQKLIGKCWMYKAGFETTVPKYISRSRELVALRAVGAVKFYKLVIDSKKQKGCSPLTHKESRVLLA